MLKLSITLMTLLVTTSLFAGVKTICGENDDRDLSFNPKVARILQVGDPAGCTVTLIGKSCAVSAGHCTSTFGIAEFNTPISRNGRIQNSKPEDTYEVDQASVRYVNGGMGNDWAVLRLKANNITGRLPGDVQGKYEIATDIVPTSGEVIRITGYGRDSADADRNFAQQSHTGPIYKVRGSTLYHQADTMGGNSGSSIVRESDQKIIGIHTHGGCSRSRSSANASTLIAKNEAFKKAIVACLQYEAQNL